MLNTAKTSDVEDILSEAAYRIRAAVAILDQAHQNKRSGPKC
jgi:hypothetical protein